MAQKNNIVNYDIEKLIKFKVFHVIFTRRDGRNLLLLKCFRTTPTHDYSLQVDLKIPIFQFADPTVEGEL